MRLPRWLVIVLISTTVITALSFAGWWWVSWPDRTAREFTELMSAEKWEEAQRMLGESPDEIWWPVVPWPGDGWHNWSHGSPIPLSRSLSEIVLGQRDFTTLTGWGYSVKRGKLHRSSKQKQIERKAGRHLIETK